MCFPAAPFARHICIKSLITHVHTPAVHCTCFHLHRLRASLACYVCVLRLRATFACSIYINNTHTHTHTCSALHVPPCCVVYVLHLHSIYIHTHSHTHTRTHTHTHAHTHTHTQTNTHTNTHTHLQCIARASLLRRLRATFARSIRKRSAVCLPDRTAR